ncbi:MAG: PE-PPE domain-containing protein [Mycobacteriaceae bacterium]
MRILARSLAHTMVVALAAALGAVLTAIGGTLTAAVTLTATALIVPGTAVPNPATIPGYMENAVDYYISPTTASCASVCIPEPVPYLAQFWPFPWEGWGGLSGAKLDESVASGVAQLTSDLVGTNNPSPQSPVVIFGYSQGATVASIEKSQLSMLSPEDQANINFVLIGNPNRPNGGLFERLAMFGTVPILDATFGMPTPTNTDMSTVDVAFQYDGVADFPLYPINLLADLNATLGFWYIHGSYLAPDGRNPDELPNGLTPTELAAAIADPANQQRLAGSDTTYVLIPTPNLPLLQPLREFGAFTHTEFLTTPLIDLIQPALGVLIETGYDRSLPYGQPAPFRLIPLVNPITLTVDLVNAIGQGIRDAAADIGGQAPTSQSPASVVPAAAAVSPVARRIAVANPVRRHPAPAAASRPVTALSATARSASAADFRHSPVRKSVGVRAAASPTTGSVDDLR